MTQTRSARRTRLASQVTHPDCFFITGTGRCGTMLLARLFDRATNGVCEHETIFRHESMIAYHARADAGEYDRDIRKALMLRVERERAAGTIFGVSSGHCHFAIPRLHERLGEGARFVLIIRKPEDFVRSALARGFFDPAHPSHCEQILPNPADPIASRWDEANPLEKCLWYWSLVNGMAIANVETLPPHLWRILRMEDFSPETLCDLAAFLGLEGITGELAADALSRGVNISPGGERSGEVNPHSLPPTLGAIDTWTDQQVVLLEHYCGRLRSHWYGTTAARMAG